MSNTPSYATVQQVELALGAKASAYAATQLLRVTRSASRKIEGMLRRRFYPLTEARTFVRPLSHAPLQAASSGFFVGDDLLSISAVTIDGTSQTVGDIELWPASGPPYSWLGVTGAEIVVTGVWGFSDTTEAAGATAEELDNTETGVDITDASLVGIGDLITVDSEAMLVTAQGQLDTGQDLASDLAEQESDVSVSVADGSDLNVGEVVLLDSERMLIVDIAANTLTVKRAWDGTVLATHSGSDLFALRTLTVERGSAGTTAATHLIAGPVTRNVAPAPIVDLCIAEALNTFLQESAGYSRVIGSGESQMEARGLGILDIRKQAHRLRRQRAGVI